MLYELFTFGKAPYPKQSNDETIEFVQNGGTLQPESSFPQCIKEIMQQCFEWEAPSRPTFEQIEKTLSQTKKERFSSI